MTIHRIRFRRMLFASILTLIVLMEVVGVVTAQSREYILTRTLFYMEEAENRNGIPTMDILNGQTDVQIDVRTETHYNCVRTVGTVQIDGIYYTVDEFRFLPVTPLCKLGCGLYELIHLLVSGTLRNTAWNDDPVMHIEADGIRYTIQIEPYLAVEMLVYTDDAFACYVRPHINEQSEPAIHTGKG